MLDFNIFQNRRIVGIEKDTFSTAPEALQQSFLDFLTQDGVEYLIISSLGDYCYDLKN